MQMHELGGCQYVPHHVDRLIPICYVVMCPLAYGQLGRTEYIRRKLWQTENSKAES